MTDPEKLARASSIENEVVVARGAKMSEDMNERSGWTYCFRREHSLLERGTVSVDIAQL